jgi:aryl-alcohol dehydrogenase-like predicted oxidoreductase
VKLADVQLGLGLIGIGKPWGVAPHGVPSDAEAAALLECAYELGVRWFDTAPSYGDGVSEERLGRFLLSLTRAERDGVVGATKFGEHWDAASGEPYADHSYDALRRSLERSLGRLDRVDVLQLHKTTPPALTSYDVARAWEFARTLGIGRLGPSITDAESARIAIADPALTVMQLPYNASYATLGEMFDAAATRGMTIAVNRPFAMGAMAEDKIAAFRFVLERRFTGVVLSGTTSREHLRQNWDAFHEATR